MSKDKSKPEATSSMNHINPLKFVEKGEKVSRESVVRDARYVDVHHVSKHSSGSSLECRWVLDFEGITHDELLLQASKRIVIALRDLDFKKCARGELASWAQRKFSVRDYLARERTRASADPMQQAQRAFSKMSEAQIVEFLRRASEVVKNK